MKLRIGCSEYEIKNNTNILEDGELGNVHPHRKVINIYNGFGEQNVQQTIWHEIVHAMLHELNENELYENERLVNGLGVMVHRFIQDNDLNKLYKTIGG